jgi:hypothetical protein
MYIYIHIYTYVYIYIHIYIYIYMYIYRVDVYFSLAQACMARLGLLFIGVGMYI